MLSEKFDQWIPEAQDKRKRWKIIEFEERKRIEGEQHELEGLKNEQVERERQMREKARRDIDKATRDGGQNKP